jgi:hypothetical protein
MRWRESTGWTRAGGDALERAGFRGLVLLAVILVSGAAGTPPRGSDRSKTEPELLALETAWDDAVVAKDTTTLRRIIKD